LISSRADTEARRVGASWGSLGNWESDRVHRRPAGDAGTLYEWTWAGSPDVISACCTSWEGRGMGVGRLRS
jgi:hypothetical protein